MGSKINLFFDDQPTINDNQYRGVGFYSQELLKGLKKSSQVNLVSSPDKADLIHRPYFDPFIPIHLKNLHKTIITIHDLVPLELPELFPLGIRAKLSWMHNRMHLSKLAHIITDSKASQKSIYRFAKVSLDRITSIPLASRSTLKPLPYQDPENYALYVGDVNPNKNLPLIVEACLETNTPLKVVGRSASSKVTQPHHPEQQDLVYLQHQAKLHPGKISLLGFVSDKDLSELYSKSLVCLQPSLAEGFGLPVLEALSLGCPVITSNQSSLPEITGSAGLLVNPSNLSQLTQAIQKIKSLTKSQRQKMIKKGKDQASKFTWSKTISETIKTYSSII